MTISSAIVGLGIVATQIVASHAGISILFPGLILATIYLYLLTGLTFGRRLVA